MAAFFVVKSALDFIKVITKILSLDVAVSNEVSALRRTLLTQVMWQALGM
jgi:hypothetical protein